MPGRRSFKTDASFLEKLAIGAIGARAVFAELERQGHKPIELERGSMGYKIWKNVKIKRLRVPDILCLNCGTRVEARAKTQLEISMSHSLSDPDRGWDKGLTDRDVVALSLCVKTGEGPTDWQCGGTIQFVSVEALRRAFAANQVVTVKPKGAGEGFELRVTWPSVVASSDGLVSALTVERLQFKRATDQRTISLALNRRDILLQPLVKVGDPVRAGQIIASVVPATAALPCSGAAAHSSFLEMLASLAVADRYTAAKALSHILNAPASTALAQRIADEREHIYVRLEAAAGLARAGEAAGMAFIKQTLQDQYLEHRLEAVIILGEIPTDESCQALTTVLLDQSQHPEIRAGAAWALGELQQPASADALVEVFLELAEPIRIEAARALRKIAAITGTNVAAELPGTQDDQRAGIAWAVSRSGRVKVDELLPLLVDDDARRWVAYILGTQDQGQFVGQVEELRRRDPEVYFAVTVLWKIVASWIYDLEEY
ncbi:MAG: HEAT repeat domain-containing protein [Verrucomicrobia bacterium]|nr:HEAT repeat domain-containing protein [Verrucomicrobiota bacterium]